MAPSILPSAQRIATRLADKFHFSPISKVDKYFIIASPNGLFPIRNSDSLCIIIFYLLNNININDRTHVLSADAGYL